MTRKLETIKLGEREFFVDDKLEEFRNVENPNDSFTVDELINALNAFNVAKVRRGLEEKRGD